MDIEQELRSYVVEQCLHRGADFDLPASEPLLGKGLMDSMQMLQLVQYLEDRYGVAVDDTDLVMDNFETIHHIAAFVERKKSRA